jgi:hypothetical protein
MAVWSIGFELVTSCSRSICNANCTTNALLLSGVPVTVSSRNVDLAARSTSMTSR